MAAAESEGLVAKAAGKGGVLRLGPSADVKIGDADVAPIPTRRVARCVVPICSMFTIAILAAVLVKVGGDVSGVLRVRTGSGVVNGLYDGVADVWMGVPYAQAPSRWAPPTPYSWQNMLDASYPGPVCPQAKALGYDLASNKTSESACLVLDIFSPHGSAKARSDGTLEQTLPVVIFFYGGEFIVGASAQAAHNASLLARRANAVVVVVQSRLGALGFLAHPALTAEAGFSGNYALLDQQAALQWVYANAEYFGGDKELVTLWGQGSGGGAALQQLTMAGSTDFFSSIIVQSAAATPVPTRVQAEAVGIKLGQAIGCPVKPASASLACLRAASTADIVAASMEPGLRESWGPVVDGVHVTAQLSAFLADTLYMRSALRGGMLAGVGRNDSTAALSFAITNTSTLLLRGGREAKHLAAPVPSRVQFEPAEAGPVLLLSPERFTAIARTTFAGARDPNAIISFYASQFGLPSDGSAGWTEPTNAAFAALSLAVTEGSLLCPTARMLAAVNASGLPAWLYRNDHPLSFVDSRLGASATMDTSLAMQQPCFLTCSNYRASFLPSETELSNKLIDTIGQFIRGHAPTSIAPWPAFRDDEGLAKLNIPTTQAGSIHDAPAACDTLWNAQDWP